MSHYKGDYAVGTTFSHHFTTVNASGVPTTLGNTPSLEYYVNAGSTGFTSGLTLSTDINTRTGLNNITVIATASATGLAAGNNVSVAIAAGTVSGVSLIGYTVLEYSLANRSALMPTTAGRTLTVASTGGAAIDWANVGNPGSTVSLSATTLFAATNVTNNVGAVVTAMNTGVTVNTNNDKTGYTVSTVQDKTGYSLTQSFPTNFSSMGIDASGNVATQARVKKNTALTKFEFLMNDSTNHAPKTGLTVTVTRSIDNGAFAAGTLSAVTEIANGIYSVDFGAGDLNGNVVTLQATANNADTTFVTFLTTP